MNLLFGLYKYILLGVIVSSIYILISVQSYGEKEESNNQSVKEVVKESNQNIHKDKGSQDLTKEEIDKKLLEIQKKYNSVVDVKLVNVCELYEQNPVAPNYEFKDKRIRFNGTLTSFNARITQHSKDKLLTTLPRPNTASLSLNTDDKVYNYDINCEGVSEQRLSQLRKDDSLTIVGNYDINSPSGGVSIMPAMKIGDIQVPKRCYLYLTNCSVQVIED